MKKILLPVLCFAAVAIGIAQLPAERQQEAQPRNMPASGRQRAPQYESVTVNDDGSVSLRIYAPKADTVMATGDLGFGVSLVKDEAGIWSGTVENVKPGAYRYAFTVDGVTVYDPVHPNFAERRPVTKVTRPGQDDFFMQKDVPHGAISKSIL
jgi:1,4-alpha-glucan branching enzyme